MVKRKMPANSHRNRKGTKKSEVKFLRVLFLISGISLSTLLYCIEDSRNYCIWLTMYALNVLASCIAFIQPKCTGNGHTLKVLQNPVYFCFGIFRTYFLGCLVNHVYFYQYLFTSCILYPFVEGYFSSTRSSFDFCPR